MRSNSYFDVIIIKVSQANVNYPILKFVVKTLQRQTLILQKSVRKFIKGQNSFNYLNDLLTICSRLVFVNIYTIAYL